MPRFLSKSRLDDLKLTGGGGQSVNHGKRGAGSRFASLAQEPSRALRHQGQQYEIHGRGYGLNSEHPAPVVRAQRQQEVIGEKRDGYADDNHQLIEGNQTAAAAGGRDLRDVHGGRENGCADCEPPADARRDEHWKARGQCRGQGRRQKQHRGHQQHASAPKAVAQGAGRKVPGHRAPAQTAHRPAEFEASGRAAEIKIVANEGHGTGNNGGIEADEKAAQRHRRGNPKQIEFAARHAHAGGRIVRLMFRSSPTPKTSPFVIYLQPVAGMLLSRSRCCQGLESRGAPNAHFLRILPPCILQFTVAESILQPVSETACIESTLDVGTE